MSTVSLSEKMSVNLDRILGSGTYGLVYPGRLKTDAKTAYKQICYCTDGSGRNEQRKELARREIDILKRLNRKSLHENIVKLLDSKHDVENSIYWLCLELCEKGNLENYMVSSKPVINVRIDIIIGCCSGLDFMHTEFHPPIIHTDIKPQNILVTEKEGKVIPKLSDFSGSGAKGTKGFLAPEMWKEGSSFTDKSDMFSLGLLVSLILCFGKEYENTQMIPFQLKEDGTQGECHSIGESMTPEKPLKLLPENFGDEDETLCTLKELVEYMVSYAPHKRPHISYIMKIIRQLPVYHTEGIANRCCCNKEKVNKSPHAENEHNNIELRFEKLEELFKKVLSTERHDDHMLMTELFENRVGKRFDKMEKLLHKTIKTSTEKDTGSRLPPYGRSLDVKQQYPLFTDILSNDRQIEGKSEGESDDDAGDSYNL